LKNGLLLLLLTTAMVTNGSNSAPGSCNITKTMMTIAKSIVSVTIATPSFRSTCPCAVVVTTFTSTYCAVVVTTIAILLPQSRQDLRLLTLPGVCFQDAIHFTQTDMRTRRRSYIHHMRDETRRNKPVNQGTQGYASESTCNNCVS
jgi:hypothetical protein